MAQADLGSAVGFVAGTDNDTTNLSLIAAARRINPDLFVAARQNQPANAPLFAAMDVDSLLVPTEVVAHEVYAQLSTPLLWRFLQEMPGHGRRVGGDVIDRLTGRCGRHLQALWKIRLTPDEAPALQPLARGRATPGSATCCATPTTGTSRCTRWRCWCCADGEVHAGARTTTSCSRPATSCCSPAGRPPAARWTRR